MRVLVIEDEPDVNHAVATFLREEGYSVDTAKDGEEGLYKATVWNYDAVLLDVMLPKIDGWRVLSDLRRTKKTPVLMLTARDAVADRVRGLNTGADDYLIKPFELSELSARVKALIRRAAGQPRPVIKIGNVELNTTTRMVSRDGVPAALTAKEYALLEFLALHRGELVTRTAIYDHLFDETDDTLSNLLDVYVSNLRRKLGHELIETRRGQGYMIHDEAPVSHE
ncbi:MAG: response regulator transcription factor [Planctomycetota bacterium]